MRHLLSSWLLVMLYCLPHAASQGEPVRTLRFEHLSVDQGLPQESVMAVVQDGAGFMWFGTQSGLARYDGYRVQTYRNQPGNTDSLADNWVRVLHIDRFGRMWVGTDGGLNLYQAHTRSFRHYVPAKGKRHGSGSRHVRAIADDGARGLWVATSDGLQHFDFDSGRFRLWQHVPGDAGSLADDQINALATDASGRLWIGTASGLDSLDPGAGRFIHHRSPKPGIKYNAVQALLVDAEQRLWIGSLAGLERWKIGSPVQQRLHIGPAFGLKNGHVTTLYQDADANVWVGSHSNGLYRWLEQGQRFAAYPHLAGDKHSVADNQVSALYRDRVGTFWVGTWYAGASRVDMGSGGFTRISWRADQPSGLSDNRVRSFLDAGDGKLWVGTNNGLNLIDPETGTGRHFLHQPSNPNSLIGNSASALARDREGMLWVGSLAGLTRLDLRRGRYTRHVLDQGDPDSNIIRFMMTDSAGFIWLASRGGLHRIDPASARLRTFRHDPADPTSLADNVVRPLLEDRHGRFWVGTFNGLGLLDRASGTFRHIRHDPQDAASLSHDEVHTLLEDSGGTLWVGTAAGLNRMSTASDGTPRFTRYTTADGLADDAIAGTLEDADGRIWISTNSGLSRLDPKSGKIRNYSAGDGTIEGAYFDGSALKGADGTLYFGGYNGMTAFRPEAVRDNQIAPRAVITGFQVFNQPAEDMLKLPIEMTRALTLNANDSVFSLEFAALHYAAPQRNLFAYQLEGFDKGWVSTDAARRFATYTNLDPGTYTFRVRAANKDGVWNADGARLEITILPPPWKTWWFRSAALLLVAGGAWTLYRARLSALRRQKEQLERLVGERTREVEQQKRELEARGRQTEHQRAEAEQRRIEAERQKDEVERQKENVEIAHRNISVLSEIGRELTATLDMETIMLTVYRHVHHLMDAPIFGIGFFREDLRLIEFPFAMDLGLRSEVYTRSMDDPHQFAVWSYRHRREVFINNLELESGNYLDAPQSGPPMPVARVDGSPRSNAVAMMYVPMIVKERMMGVLCVQSTEPDAYRRVHLDMLQTLAAHAAVALDNARAYRKLEETQVRLLEQERQVRINTEELARAKQRAEDATRQKSEFLANMSHEMRTPLAGVIGMLGFAMRDTSLAENMREQIGRGQANAQSLLGIINDLLDFSKIEAGKLTIENIDFALAAIIENVFSLFEEQAAAKSVDFGIELADDLPPFVVGDPTRLRQVLVNLVGNAFKFTTSGSVRVRVERMPAAPAGTNLIRFVVQDTGIGIVPAALERLFQKFEQADSTTTRRYGGTGLGLAICRQLVELMDGQILVDSVVNVGSTFCVVLPLPDGVAPPLAPPVPREPHSHRLKVLCAEDFATNQMIIRMMLEELGHVVDIAENGVLALAACAHRRYDLILMDGRMPEMDGASATRLIRAGGPPGAPVRDKDLMIIALTANASEEDRSRYLASGMDDFLTKPIDEGALHFQLSRAIERQLRRGVALEPITAATVLPVPSRDELDAMFAVAPEGALAQRLLAAFCTDLPARRAELEAALEQRDQDAAGRILHGLKGSAAYLDASALQRLCDELETAAEAGQWERIEQSMARLSELLDQFDSGARLPGAGSNLM